MAGARARFQAGDAAVGTQFAPARLGVSDFDLELGMSDSNDSAAYFAVVEPDRLARMQPAQIAR
jgi:hypothetical protein